MKIEIGESLLYSWLRHAKGCQLVQINWKASIHSWEVKNEAAIQQLMLDTSELFRNKYNVELFKGTTSHTQLLQQAEIDVLGTGFENGEVSLYAIDVAFHEAGLNYGSKEETALRVAKKIVRSAMCIYGYFNILDGDIIFASPKINASVLTLTQEYTTEILALLIGAGLNYKVRIITNDDFHELIMKPVIAASATVADTSELFMRSMQMYNMFAGTTVRPVLRTARVIGPPEDSQENIDITGFKGLKEMKIGVLVRSVLTAMLQNHEISKDEIELMQTERYSKDTFHIQYPLLRKASLSNGEKVLRYWAGAIEAYGERYFICSEWFEVPQNNDRLFFMKWLATRK
jgi:hypothetical protein